MSVPQINIIGETMSVSFDRFDIASYDLFLRVKRLPEYQLCFDPLAETYTVAAPARFAAMLGVEVPAVRMGDLPFAPFLFDDQLAIVKMALAAKRFAYWGDCGLGKTLVELEFARQVAHLTGGRVLIVTMNEIIPQYLAECRKFYGDSLPIVHLETREQMKQWCQTGERLNTSLQKDGSAPATPDTNLLPVGTARIAIVNYEKFNHKTAADQVVNELRYLAGIVLDESSRLKGGGGKQKWALIKSAKGIVYKLSCTATPAPNEIMEFASQASFLEKMRSENDIIWTYFRRDEKTHRWTVKQHARQAFFEFMSSWSIYVRDPRRYGWRKDIAVPPLPETVIHTIDATHEQRQFVMDFNAEVVPAADKSGTAMMFSGQYNAIQSTKLSQAAKGFNYVKASGGRDVKLIHSCKPAAVSALALHEAINEGLQVLVWCEFDAEINILATLLNESPLQIPKKSGKGLVSFEGELPKVEVLTGKISKAKRQPIKDRFQSGETRILITRSDLMGYGQNLQNVGAMIFSGWTYSYEDFYQAVRRAYRHGQTRSVRIHVPVIPELEGQMWDAICRKQSQHEAAIAEMEANYIAGFKAVHEIKEVAA